MSYSDDTNSDQEWKNEKAIISTKSNIKSTNKPKYPQKFLEKWIKMFGPWLTRCKNDPNKPYCKACQTRLDANRCHLQRHEGTSKHARNLEILISKGEGAVQENLSVRRERSKYYKQCKVLPEEMDMDTVEGYAEDDGNADDNVTEANEVYLEEPIIKEEYTDNSISQKNSSRKRHIDEPKLTSTKKERINLLKQIQNDKHDLIESFREILSSSGLNAMVQQPHPPTTSTSQQQPAQEKNHIDLFFESVSSSVKALTPKLIAEAKMRVSQLIGELELRALTELENQQTAASLQNNQSYVL